MENHIRRNLVSALHMLSLALDNLAIAAEIAAELLDETDWADKELDDAREGAELRISAAFVHMDQLEELTDRAQGRVLDGADQRPTPDPLPSYHPDAIERDYLGPDEQPAPYGLG